MQAAEAIRSSAIIMAPSCKGLFLKNIFSNVRNHSRIESRLYFDAHERDAPNHDATNPIRAYHSRNALLFLSTYRPTRKPRCTEAGLR